MITATILLVATKVLLLATAAFAFEGESDARADFTGSIPLRFQTDG
jgi:hypothetical protein